MAVSSGRRKHRDTEAKEESLSPPPPRALPEPESVKNHRREHRPVAATSLCKPITAAEAVASALRLWPASAEQNSPSHTRAGVSENAAGLDAEVHDLVRIAPNEIEERRNAHGFPDLAPIAECPTEVVPERTPETSSRVTSKSLPGSHKSLPGSEGIVRQASSSCSLSTDVPSVSVNISSPLDSPIDRQRHRPVPTPVPFFNRRSKPANGSCVSFFVDGCPNQYFGRIRTVAPNGTYTVDLVGGGRMAGLHTVTPCSVEDLEKAQRSKQPVVTSDNPWATLNSPNTWPVSRSTSVDKLASGTPVTFSLEDYVEPFYGYVRGIGRDGCYVIDLIGGGRRTGVKEVTRCAELDLVKVNRLRQGWRTGKDDWTDKNSPNSPSWGGGIGYSSGYRETNSAPGTRRSLSMRAPSTSGLFTASSSRSSNSDMTRRSLSPPHFFQRRRGHSREDIVEGSPVMIFVEGDVRPHFGRIRSIDAGGRYSVDLIGGQRKVGLRTVFGCSEAELEKEAKTKRPVITRRTAWDDVATRNRLPDENRSQSPTLRGVAINLPPRSSTILCA